MRLSPFIRFAAAAMLFATAGLARAAPPAPAVTAFVHANVVPMDRERVLRDQTVIVTGDTITAIGRNVPVPANARIIDARGAYLSPGLADMHTHSDTREDMAVYLANGVTTVLSMGGARARFVDSVVPAANGGRFPSPHVYTSFLVDGSPDYNGFVIKTPEEARAVVGLAKTNNYDFIKVYVNLAAPVYEALADEARRQHMPLVGHGVYAVRLERQLALGQPLVAHAEEFFYSHFTPPGVKESDTPPDEARIPEAVALAKRHGATIMADLVTYGAIAAQIGHRERVTAALTSAEADLLSPAVRLAWMRSSYPDKTAKLGAKYHFLQKLVKAMANAGVSMVAGSDAPAVPTLLPGFSLHDNLDELERAGLTRFQALSITTAQAGDFIRRTKGGPGFGTITAGSRADLVLTAANPLEGLATLRRPLGVMAKGRWHDAADLAGLLAEVRASYRSAAPAGRSVERD